MFASGRRRGEPGHRLPAGAPGTDGDLRLRGRLRPGRRQADAVDHLAGPPRPPDGVRAGAGLPEHKIRVIAPDIGGGFGNKVPIYPGYVCAIVASLVPGQAGQVDGGPLGEPDQYRRSPATTSCAARSPPPRRQDPGHPHQRPGRSRRLQRHGGPPTKFPAGFFGVFTGSYDPEAAYCKMTAVYTNKAPGGVAYACSFRITEAVYLVERMVDCLARRARDGPGRAADEELHQARAVPLHDQDRLGLRLG